MGLLHRHQTLLILAAIVLVAALVASVSPLVMERIVIDTLIKLVMVVGLSVFIGNSGVISFGHTGFMVIGAYAGAWLSMPPNVKQIFLRELPDWLIALQLPAVPSLLGGAALAAAVALVVGLPLMRLSGIAASIGTLSFLLICNIVYSHWTAISNGTGSLVGLPLFVDIPMAAGAALAAIAVAWAFQESSIGLRLRASREDEAAARASGIDVALLRLAAFCLSAAIVAVGGALQAHFLGTLTVGQFFIAITFLTLAMLVVGGTGSLSGAVVGTFAVAAASELLRLVEGDHDIAGVAITLPPGVRDVGLAAIMLAILLLRPKGITGGREIVLVSRPPRRLAPVLDMTSRERTE
ncbi:MAG: branched-chain amino acid ABC transporter permease [Azospirillaceae bacterium]